MNAAEHVYEVLQDSPSWVCTVCGWRPQDGLAPEEVRTGNGYCVHTGNSIGGCVHGTKHDHYPTINCVCTCHQPEVEVDDETLERVKESLQRLVSQR